MAEGVRQEVAGGLGAPGCAVLDAWEWIAPYLSSGMEVSGRWCCCSPAPFEPSSHGLLGLRGATGAFHPAVAGPLAKPDDENMQNRNFSANSHTRASSSAGDFSDS